MLYVYLPNKAGRSLPQIKKSTRSITKSIVPGFSMNGVAVGQDYSKLKLLFVENIEEHRKGERLEILDQSDSKILRLDLELPNERVAKVDSLRRGTIMFDGSPVVTDGDPPAILDNLPWTPEASSTNELLIYRNSKGLGYLIVRRNETCIEHLTLSSGLP